LPRKGDRKVIAGRFIQAAAQVAQPGLIETVPASHNYPYIRLLTRPIPAPALPLKGRVKINFSAFKGKIERGMGR